MNNIINIKKDIEQLLTERRISSALNVLENVVTTDIALREVRADIAALRESYSFMTKYALDSMPDPGRYALYDEIVASIRSITDRIIRNSKISEASTLYFNTLRYINLQHDESVTSLINEYRRINDKLSLSVLAENVEKVQRELTLRSEDLEKRIFNRIWVSYPMNVDDQAVIESVFDDKALPSYFKSLIVGAVMLGLFEFYDERRIRLLIEAYGSYDEELSVRALCGLIIALWFYRNRPMSRKLLARFDVLSDLPGWTDDVKMIQLQLIRARETERISRKLTDEVIPQMMKLKPEIEKLRNIPMDGDSIEMNPEWEELLEKSGVADKLKELQEIQEDGGDVLMGTFSRLKTFSFFNDISNWFLPFHSSHSLLSGAYDEALRILFDGIVSAPMFCNSDKFSVILSLGQVPESQRKLMTDQLKAHADQMTQINLSGINTGKQDRERIANKFMQDLYRFFKLFRRKGEFRDPFSTSLNLVVHPLLQNLFDDADTLRLVGEFYFKRQYYTDAFDIFEKLSLKVPPSAELFQKMGYCRQFVGDIHEAIRYYEQSELLNADSRWTMRRLASCHKILKQWDKALPYYQRLSEFNPDDVTLTLNIGYCLMETGDYDGAMKCFFKAEFISGESEKSTRPIAWCSLLAGDYERARKYIDILLVGTPSVADYLNAGHLELLTGHLNEAVDRYASSISADNFNVDNFLKSMNGDAFLTARSEYVDDLLMGIVIDNAIAKSRTNL